jgi:hypothetical protein
MPDMARFKPNNPRTANGRQPNMSPRAGKRDAHTHVPRKTFNCIVDESALIAGVKAAYLKKWIVKGDVCMFVPLQSTFVLRKRRQQIAH